MSTPQTRTAALELAVDLACAQAECLGVDVSTETVLARAEKFDAYIVGTGTPSLLAQAAGAAAPSGGREHVPLTYCAFDEVPADWGSNENPDEAARARRRKVTPADVFARGRMSR